jgi:hypothetical protein
LLRIVDGTRMSALIWKVLVREERWEDRKTWKIYSTEKIAFEPTPVWCPVVMLGHYVLTGWGQEEKVLEDARRWSWSLLLIAVMLQAMACGLIALSRLLHPVCNYGAVVAGAMGMLSFMGSVWERTAARQQPRDLPRLLSLGLRWFTGSVGLMGTTLGFVGNKVSLVIFGVACVAFVAGWSFLRQLRTTRR